MKLVECTFTDDLTIGICGWWGSIGELSHKQKYVSRPVERIIVLLYDVYNSTKVLKQEIAV